MKKYVYMVLALAMVFVLTTVAGAQESLVVRDDSDYASMTMEELYEAALKEAAEGKSLVVYSETGSVSKSVAQFMEDFPGIQAEGTKYKPAVIAEKIPLEFDGEPYADVILTSDGTGEFYLDWYKKGYVTAYYQKDVEAALIPEFAFYGLPLSIEGDVWFYNTAAFPDGAPINNWWDVVEMKEDGTSVYTITSYPVSNLNFVSMLSNLVKNADMLEKAYEEKYGTPIEYTYPDDSGVEENNAAYEWIYRYLQTKYIENTSASEITAAVAASTAEDPVLGFTGTVNLGDALELEQPVDLVLTMAGFNGFSRAKMVYLCTKTDSPAIAHLYMLYMMGGEDGTGRGYDTYVNRLGCYPSRTDVDSTAWNTVSFEDMNILASDVEFVYYNYLDVQDFYNYYAEEFK